MVLQLASAQLTGDMSCMQPPPAAVAHEVTVEAPKAKAVRLYQEGLTCKEAGAAVSRSASWVLAALREAGVPSRRPGIGITADCNQEFFDSWSPEMAWVLGNLWARGCITQSRGTLLMAFNSTSEDVVRKTAWHIGYTGRIASYVSRTNPATSSPKPYFRWEVSRPRVIAAVQALGLTMRKTVTKPFPDVPDEFLSHFMRGYCESGAAFATQSDGLRVTLTIQSGSRAFVEGVAQRLHRAGFGRGATGEPLPIRERQGQMLGKPGAVLYHVSLARMDVLPWLYQGANETMWMQRRRDTFVQIVANRVRAGLPVPHVLMPAMQPDF